MIVHSKVMVIVPLSEDPVIVTGSHNFSASASEKNDENPVIVRGQKKLARAYAAYVMSGVSALSLPLVYPRNAGKGKDTLELPRRRRSMAQGGTAAFAIRPGGILFRYAAAEGLNPRPKKSHGVKLMITDT